MVSSCRNNGTISQELRYPFTGTVVQFWQESSTEIEVVDVSTSTDSLVNLDFLLDCRIYFRFEAL